jgi:hypothetical protein
MTNHHAINPEFSRWQLDYEVKWKESYYSVFECTVSRNYSNLYRPNLLPLQQNRPEFLLYIRLLRSYFWCTFVRFLVHWLGYSGINWPHISWEAHILPGTPGNRHYSWNLKVYFRVYKSSLLVCILSKMNLIHIHAPYFIKIICLVLPLYLHLDTPSFLLAAGFTTSVLYGWLICLTGAMCPRFTEQI